MNLEEILLNLLNSEKTEISFEELFLRLFTAILVSFSISLVNYFTYTGDKFDKSISHAQIIATISFAIMINVLGKNLAMAVGIFGSLSFIQFRSSLKDSKDTAIFFYSVVMGVAAGSGLYKLLILGFITISICQIILKFYPINDKIHRTLYIDYETSDTIKEIKFFLKQKKIKYKILESNPMKKRIKFKFFLSNSQMNLLIEELHLSFSEKLKNLKYK